MEIVHCDKILGCNKENLSIASISKYTTLFGRVPNGFSHDFKFTETCSDFHTIL